MVFNTPEPFFSNIRTKAEHHTKENMTIIMISIIIEVDPLRIVGIVTDTYGCLLHGIHLFLKDLCTNLFSIVENKNYSLGVKKEARSNQILLAIFINKSYMRV